VPIKKNSLVVHVPSGVSSFFEICDTETDGSRITENQRIGSRGGGFIIRKGSMTAASRISSKYDLVTINGKIRDDARTTLKVVELMRREFDIGCVRISHKIEPPIGAGFGTSGSGAIGTAMAISDLFELHLTLSEAAHFAHSSEIECLTGLGTVISLVSGSGAIGLVTEPGEYGIGKVDAIIADYDHYLLVCASFGPIEKSSVLTSESRRSQVNEFGAEAMRIIRKERTVESLLSNSRIFAERTGLASKTILKLVDAAVGLGAIGATQNMIGNGIHCLIDRSKRAQFMKQFVRLVPKENIFESELYHGGPKLTKA